MKQIMVVEIMMVLRALPSFKMRLVGDSTISNTRSGWSDLGGKD
ncbi:hypothetical protein [Paenibacillus sp. yr247]|nr:hypothetical protein [Paenibacillus sp. yr247]